MWPLEYFAVVNCLVEHPPSTISTIIFWTKQLAVDSCLYPFDLLENKIVRLLIFSLMLYSITCGRTNLNMTIFTSELSIVYNQLKSSSGLKEFQWVWVVWAYCCVGTCLVSVQTFITDLHSGLQSYHWSVQFSSVRQLFHQSVNHIKLPISNAEVCGTPNKILLLFVSFIEQKRPEERRFGTWK